MSLTCALYSLAINSFEPVATVRRFWAIKDFTVLYDEATKLSDQCNILGFCACLVAAIRCFRAMLPQIAAQHDADGGILENGPSTLSTNELNRLNPLHPITLRNAIRRLLAHPRKEAKNSPRLYKILEATYLRNVFWMLFLWGKFLYILNFG